MTRLLAHEAMERRMIRDDVGYVACGIRKL
jgi:hypothetical protein